jgi:hypothetical protein
MNTYQYIALVIIGISASGIQGMNWMQRMQTTCLPQVTQLVQKLSPYRYHIGGALALAGIVYGGYYCWKKSSNLASVTKVNEHNVSGKRPNALDATSCGGLDSEKLKRANIRSSSCRIAYTASIRPTQSAGPYYSVAIESIFLNNQKIPRSRVPSISWKEGDGQMAIDNFIQQVCADLPDKSKDLPACNFYTLPVSIMYSGWRIDTTIEKMHEVKPQLAKCFNLV